MMATLNNNIEFLSALAGEDFRTDEQQPPAHRLRL